ncbi:30S ribosomal protein S20 [Patescibacteria group bacterium]|nr:30S ribosomal protein S20 [Patescibacteria group bacterium]
MANIRSAKKRIKTSAKRRVRNLGRKRVAKGKVKGVLKKALDEKKSVEEIKEELAGTYKAIDKAAQSRAIHPNKASRMKGRLTRKINRGGMRGK